MKKLLFSLLMLWISIPSFAVVLAWDPSPDASVVGYSIYYGTNSGSYQKRVDAGTSTNCYINTTNLFKFPKTNFFVATAYTIQGVESLPSNEVFYQFTNYPPVFSSTVTNQTYTMFTSFPFIRFSIYDIDSPLNKLRFMITSSNPSVFSCLGAYVYAVIPNSTNRILAFSPPSAEDIKNRLDTLKPGTSEISVIVKDDNNNSATNKFLVTVLPKKKVIFLLSPKLEEMMK
jgi:hypothetical protein